MYLLFSSDEPIDEYEEPVFTDNDDALNVVDNTPVQESIEFSTVGDTEVPLTTTPNPVPLGQVVLGTDAKNVLTLGTNGKTSVMIVSVQLAEAPFDGFEFNDNCSGKLLRGKETCDVTMSWTPVVAGNVQNNFIVSWHESNVSQNSAKAEKYRFTAMPSIRKTAISAKPFRGRPAAGRQPPRRQRKCSGQSSVRAAP